MKVVTPFVPHLRPSTERRGIREDGRSGHWAVVKGRGPKISQRSLQATDVDCHNSPQPSSFALFDRWHSTMFFDDKKVQGTFVEVNQFVIFSLDRMTVRRTLDGKYSLHTKGEWAKRRKPCTRGGKGKSSITLNWMRHGDQKCRQRKMGDE